jgi:hypothetical protein
VLYTDVKDVKQGWLGKGASSLFNEGRKVRDFVYKFHTEYCGETNIMTADTFQFKFLNKWKGTFIRLGSAHPGAYVYCFRSQCLPATKHRPPYNGIL